MAYRIDFINRVIYLILFIWTTIILIASVISIHKNYEYADILAKNEAIVSIKKDLAYRSWGSSHGGVYVPITKRTPPNPYLLHIKNRDINSTTGLQLTLMNPAYILSQMMKEYSEFYGTKGHITSRILMNPKNKPDKWEEKMLKEVEVSKKTKSTKAFIDGEEYFRYLRPLVTEKSCLKCHAFQGYKEGDVRGGVSVSIPMKQYYKDALNHTILNIVIIIFIYILGLFVIFFAKKRATEILENKIKDYEQHIFSLVSIIEKRDSYTAGHSQRVANYSVLIAKEMKFSIKDIDNLYRASILHDIGKISTPDSILLKPGSLTELEYQIIKEHVVVSYELLKSVDIYKDIVEIIRHHHEHYDGNGYPQGLKGENIPILSQIMIIADAFDAMTTNRIYRAKKSVTEAIRELNRLSSKQFPPKIVPFATIALKDVIVESTITQQPKTKIEKERFSYFYKDQITGIYNKSYLEFVLANNYSQEFQMKSINMMYLHNFSQYNKKHGWNDGDKLLKKFAELLKEINNSNFIFRVYGDDFITLNREKYYLLDYRLKLENFLLDTGISLSFRYFDIKREKISDMETLENLL